MQFIEFVVGLWFLGVFVTWPYFWLKRTDRTQAPVIRRFTSLAYASIWPYAAFQTIARRGDR